MRAVAAPPLPRGRLPAAGLAAAVLAVLGGCGSSGSSASAPDPATVVPASAQLYAEAEVRAHGAKAAEAVAGAQKLSHMTQPYLGLMAALLTPGSAPLNYARDVAPWLGRRAGLYLSSASAASALEPILQAGLLGSGSSPAAGGLPFNAGGVDGALVLDTTDAGRARSFLEQQAGRAGAHASSYRGVAYRVTASGLAFGMVGSFAVIGSEAGLHAVVDTRAGGGGGALAHSQQYAALAAKAPAEAIAHVYTTPAGAGPQTASGPLAALTGARLAYVSAIVHSGAITLVADTRPAPAGEGAGTSGGGLLSAGSEAASALARLPGESWLAVGLAHLGTTLPSDVAGLRELSALLGGGGEAPAGTPATGLSVKGLIGGLLAPLGALAGRTPQARAQNARWMGSGGVFASGSGLLELKAAVVIESTQPALSRAAVGMLAAELRRAGDETQAVTIPGTEAAVGVRVTGLPVMLDVAAGRSSDGRTLFVLGVGEAAVQEALNPSSTMASSTSYSAAQAALGEGIAPSVVFQTPTLVALLEGIGLAEDPSVAKVLGYLRAVGPIYGGGHSVGGEGERFRLVVSLQR